MDKFCEYFQDEINNNHFVRLTIRTLATFIIKRFNYPYSTFKNISFFSFDKDSHSYEYKNKCNLIKIFICKKDEDFKLGLKDFFPSTIINKKGYDVKHKNKTYDFQMTDFKLLKRLHNGTKATYYLAIHIKTFYIFVIKFFSNIEFHQKEMIFAQNYSYEYLTPFYGSVKLWKKKKFSPSNNFNIIFSPLKQILFKVYSETELQTKDNHKSTKINKMLTKVSESCNNYDVKVAFSSELVQRSMIFFRKD